VKQAPETADWPVVVPPGYQVGQWRVGAPIAAGQWGSVYAGENTSVALKFLPTGTLTPRQLGHLAQMAGREVQGHLQLKHPRLIRCHEVLTVNDPGHALDGVVVIVMERAQQSLEAMLGRGAVPEGERLLGELAEALAYLHDRSWVHGDLKPDNVLVMPDGSVRLSDFGLSAQLTGTHAYLPPIGTPDYLPPERQEEKLGANGLKVRLSADVWAYGVIAHRVLTGRHPFPGASARARADAAARCASGQDSLVLGSDVPEGWRDILQGCLAPNQAVSKRMDARALLKSVRAAPRRPLRRRPLAWGVGLLVALAAAAGLGLPPVLGWYDDDTAPISASMLSANADIPPQYRQLIIDAGTRECVHPAVNPALVAAILKAESNFDANLSDPAKDEYGIARWTPRVLQGQLPADQQNSEPVPPFPPEMSIPAVGRYLCFLAPTVSNVPGERHLLLAAAYRTSGTTVREEGGVPERLAPYIRRVDAAYRLYAPSTGR
jgi:serine/threonine protein kinase